MRRKRGGISGLAGPVALAGLLVLLLLATGASAISPEFGKFRHCPYLKRGVFRCLHSVTANGSVALGKGEVPIVNPVVLRGGYGGVVDGFSTLLPPTKGPILSAEPQPVSGGLMGIVSSEESPPAIRLLAALLSATEVAGVEVGLELAGKVRISEAGLRLKEGVALELPVKIHLQNVLLGDNCYIGSERLPLSWELTASTTEASPGKTVSGDSGSIQLLEGGRILRMVDNKLVDGGWGAPEADDCGRWLSFLVDPLVDSAVGLPGARGNLAILDNTIDIATATSMRNATEGAR